MSNFINQANLNEVMRHQLELAVNQLLQAELLAVLGYESYEYSSNGNYRNGSYERVFDTKFGKITVNIPREMVNLKIQLCPSILIRMIR